MAEATKKDLPHTAKAHRQECLCYWRAMPAPRNWWRVNQSNTLTFLDDPTRTGL